METGNMTVSEYQKATDTLREDLAALVKARLDQYKAETGADVYFVRITGQTLDEGLEFSTCVDVPYLTRQGSLR